MLDDCVSYDIELLKQYIKIGANSNVLVFDSDKSGITKRLILLMINYYQNMYSDDISKFYIPSYDIKDLSWDTDLNNIKLFGYPVQIVPELESGKELDSYFLSLGCSHANIKTKLVIAAGQNVLLGSC